jgi:ATP-dependent Lon protease
MRGFDIPEALPILPLRNTVAFPFVVLPLSVGIPRSVRLVEEALKGGHLVGLLASRDGSIDEPVPGQIYEVGTIAKIHHAVRIRGDQMHAVVEGLERFRIKHWVGTDPYLRAHIELAADEVEAGVELEAMMHTVRDLAKQIITLLPNLSEEAGGFLDSLEDPRYLFYLVATNAGLSLKTNQEMLELDRLKEKYETLISHLMREKEVLSLGRKIQSEAQDKISKAQRDYYLREQLKAIKKELGEADETESEILEYSAKIEAARLTDEALKEARRELKRMKTMTPQSAEYAVIRTYLDWLMDLPWNEFSQDQLDVNHARNVLDEDHYDLQEVKDRIIEYLAVRKLIEERQGNQEIKRQDGDDLAMGAILCFVGPPGVGKTSLGHSIARALGRKFTRMSLGGMRDEAEIRGHRRTYIGAMPGRIIQAIKRAGTRNPVFMLDEVDKIGSDWRGDPGSALLEVLDPAQNHAFRDHYLDLDFDLSDVVFITTANQLETIPAPLRDRMEIIHLEGYTEHEKLFIALNFLAPRQLRLNGLREKEVIFTEEALRKIIQDYTREAGVRNLERQIGTVCRKVAVKIAAGDPAQKEMSPATVRDYLKKEKFESELSETFDISGIATALAVTATGGDIIFIEATRVPGSGKLTLTGQLGDVMRESGQIAHSYVWSKSARLGINSKNFEKCDVHLHVPAGAIPKDGPSAGIAMVTAIASLFSGRPVRDSIGMTGEITLRGRVLPVGGIKMKVLAAHRAGLTTVILPQKNIDDLEDIPEEVGKAIKFIPVTRIDEALARALEPCKKEAPRRKKLKGRQVGKQ